MPAARVLNAALRRPRLVARTALAPPRVAASSLAQQRCPAPDYALLANNLAAARAAAPSLATQPLSLTEKASLALRTLYRSRFLTHDSSDPKFFASNPHTSWQPPHSNPSLLLLFVADSLWPPEGRG
jgi:hypothetical protein